MRFTFEFPDNVRERIEVLKKLTGATSTAEVLKNALSVYDMLVHIREKEGLVRLIHGGQEGELFLWPDMPRAKNPPPPWGPLTKGGLAGGALEPPVQSAAEGDVK